MNDSNIKEQLELITKQIRTFGYIQRGYVEKDYFDDYSCEYRIDLPNDKLVVTLKEKNFSSCISLSYSELIESRNIEFNSINNSIIRSTKTTQERYGMVYDIEVSENIKIIKAVTDSIDKDFILEQKISKGFITSFDIVYKGFDLIGVLQNKLTKEEMKVIRENCYKRIDRFTDRKIKIRYLPTTMVDFNDKPISIEECKNIIEKSKDFVNRNITLIKVLKMKMEIIYEENELYLRFVKSSIKDRFLEYIK
jgi:6-pyruvoyl-tetrahydropterin synthase